MKGPDLADSHSGTRTDSTVCFLIGGHVNVLSDYKETVIEIFFISTQSLHAVMTHVTDMLTKFRQNHISQAF